MKPIITLLPMVGFITSELPNELYLFKIDVENDIEHTLSILRSEIFLDFLFYTSLDFFVTTIFKYD